MQAVEIPPLLPTLICIQRCQYQNIQDSATQIFMWFSSEMSTLDGCVSLGKEYKVHEKKPQQPPLFLN